MKKQRAIRTEKDDKATFAGIYVGAWREHFGTIAKYSVTYYFDYGYYMVFGSWVLMFGSGGFYGYWRLATWLLCCPCLWQYVNPSEKKKVGAIVNDDASMGSGVVVGDSTTTVLGEKDDLS